MYYKRKQEKYDIGENKFITDKLCSVYNQYINPLDFVILEHYVEKYLIGLGEEILIAYYSYFDIGFIRRYIFFFNTEEDMLLFRIKYNL